MRGRRAGVWRRESVGRRRRGRELRGRSRIVAGGSRRVVVRVLGNREGEEKQRRFRVGNKIRRGMVMRARRSVMGRDYIRMLRRWRLRLLSYRHLFRCHGMRVRKEGWRRYRKSMCRRLRRRLRLLRLRRLPSWRQRLGSRHSSSLGIMATETVTDLHLSIWEETPWSRHCILGLYGHFSLWLRRCGSFRICLRLCRRRGRRCLERGVSRRPHDGRVGCTFSTRNGAAIPGIPTTATSTAECLPIRHAAHIRHLSTLLLSAPHAPIILIKQLLPTTALNINITQVSGSAGRGECEGDAKMSDADLRRETGCQFCGRELERGGGGEVQRDVGVCGVWRETGGAGLLRLGGDWFWRLGEENDIEGVNRQRLMVQFCLWHNRPKLSAITSARIKMPTLFRLHASTRRLHHARDPPSTSLPSPRKLNIRLALPSSKEATDPLSPSPRNGLAACSTAGTTARSTTPPHPLYYGD